LTNRQFSEGEACAYWRWGEFNQQAQASTQIARCMIHELPNSNSALLSISIALEIWAVSDKKKGLAAGAYYCDWHSETQRAST
jgi:hypothetical protein